MGALILAGLLFLNQRTLKDRSRNQSLRDPAARDTIGLHPSSIGSWISK